MIVDETEKIRLSVLWISIRMTKIGNSNHAHGEVYSIQHYYVVKFVSVLRHVDGFLRVFWFPPPITLTATNITEISLKVALNTIILTH